MAAGQLLEGLLRDARQNSPSMLVAKPEQGQEGSGCTNRICRDSAAPATGTLRRTSTALLQQQLGEKMSSVVLFRHKRHPELQWLSRSSHGLPPPRVARLRARSARGKFGVGAV